MAQCRNCNKEAGRWKRLCAACAPKPKESPYLTAGDPAKGGDNGFAVLYTDYNWLWPRGSEYLEKCCDSLAEAQRICMELRSRGTLARIEDWRDDKFKFREKANSEAKPRIAFC